jgi:XRE family transcriptional regulator, regulator of sulfur utilization
MVLITNLVGTRIRSIRSQRKLTQKQLADLAGIPRATLATVERDDSNPSLAVVFKVANALGMTLDQLVESTRQRVHKFPAEQMHKVNSGDGAYKSVTVTAPNLFHLTQQVFHLKPGGVYHGKPHPPGSEEHLHILGGEVVLDVPQESVSLKAGDSACFHGNVRHVYSNKGDTDGWGMVTILEGIGPEMFRNDV